MVETVEPAHDVHGRDGFCLCARRHGHFHRRHPHKVRPPYSTRATTPLSPWLHADTCRVTPCMILAPSQRSLFEMSGAASSARRAGAAAPCTLACAPYRVQRGTAGELCARPSCALCAVQAPDARAPKVRVGGMRKTPARRRRAARIRVQCVLSGHPTHGRPRCGWVGDVENACAPLACWARGIGVHV